MPMQSIQSVQQTGAVQAASARTSYGKIRTIDSPKSKKPPAVTRRESEYFDLLKTLLAGKKYTFLFDIDNTITTPSSEFSPSEVDKISFNYGINIVLKYILQRTFPTSIGHVELFNVLSDLEQNIGFITKGSIDALIRLKVAGVNFNDIDFVSIEPPINTDYHSTAAYGECLEIEDKIRDFNDLLKAVEEKHGIKIDLYPPEGNKRYAQGQLYENGDEHIRAILEKPIIAIGDGVEDPYLAYPYKDFEQRYHCYEPVKGGIGIQLLGKSPKDSRDTVVHSLGRAVCYAASLITGDSRGKEHVDDMSSKCEITKKPIRREDKVISEAHKITTHSNRRDVNKTWEELLKQGPIQEPDDDINSILQVLRRFN